VVANPDVVDYLILWCPESCGARHVIYEKGDTLIFQKIGADLAKEPRHDAITKSAIVGLLQVVPRSFLGAIVNSGAYCGFGYRVVPRLFGEIGTYFLKNQGIPFS